MATLKPILHETNSATRERDLGPKLPPQAMQLFGKEEDKESGRRFGRDDISSSYFEALKSDNLGTQPRGRGEGEFRSLGSLLSMSSTSGGGETLASHHPTTSDTAAAPPSSNQLTIFYNGVVNAYANIPADKAHAIMLLAGSASVPQQQIVSDHAFIPTPKPTPPSVSSASISKHRLSCLPSAVHAAEPNHQQSHTRSSTTDLPVARMASLARFLEQRKHSVVQAQVSKDNVLDKCKRKEEARSMQPADRCRNPKRCCIGPVIPRFAIQSTTTNQLI